jgi:hypothetical protein
VVNDSQIHEGAQAFADCTGLISERSIIQLEQHVPAAANGLGRGSGRLATREDASPTSFGQAIG